MALGETGHGCVHLRVLPETWAGVSAGACPPQRRRRARATFHLFLGIGVALFLSRGVEAVTTTDDTKSTMEFSASLWTATELQTHPTSSGAPAVVVESAGYTSWDTGKQTTNSLTASSVNISPNSSQDGKTSLTQEDVSHESSTIPTSQTADETSGVSGLTQISIFTNQTFITPPSLVMSSNVAVPSVSLSFEASSISKETSPDLDRSLIVSSFSSSPQSSTLSSSSTSLSSSSSTTFPLPVTVSQTTSTFPETHAQTTDEPLATHSQSSVNNVYLPSTNIVSNAVNGNVSPQSTDIQTYSDGDSRGSTSFFSTAIFESTSNLPINNILYAYLTDSAHVLTSQPTNPTVYDTRYSVSPSSENEFLSTSSISSSTTKSASPLATNSLLSSQSTERLDALSSQSFTEIITEPVHETNATISPSPESESSSSHFISSSPSESTSDRLEGISKSHSTASVYQHSSDPSAELVTEPLYNPITNTESLFTNFISSSPSESTSHLPTEGIVKSHSTASVYQHSSDPSAELVTEPLYNPITNTQSLFTNFISSSPSESTSHLPTEGIVNSHSTASVYQHSSDLSVEMMTESFYDTNATTESVSINVILTTTSNSTSYHSTESILPPHLTDSGYTRSTEPITEMVTEPIYDTNSTAAAYSENESLSTSFISPPTSESRSPFLTDSLSNSHSPGSVSPITSEVITTIATEQVYVTSMTVPPSFESESFSTDLDLSPSYESSSSLTSDSILISHSTDSVHSVSREHTTTHVTEEVYDSISTVSSSSESESFSGNFISTPTSESESFSGNFISTPTSENESFSGNFISMPTSESESFSGNFISTPTSESRLSRLTDSMYYSDSTDRIYSISDQHITSVTEQVSDTDVTMSLSSVSKSQSLDVTISSFSVTGSSYASTTVPPYSANTEVDSISDKSSSQNIESPTVYTTVPEHVYSSVLITDTVLASNAAVTLPFNSLATDYTFSSSSSVTQATITPIDMSKGTTDAQSLTVSVSEGSTASRSSSVEVASVSLVSETAQLNTDVAGNTTSQTALHVTSSSTPEPTQTVSLQATSGNVRQTSFSFLTSMVSKRFTETDTHSSSTEGTNFQYSTALTEIPPSESSIFTDIYGNVSEYSDNTFTTKYELSSSIPPVTTVQDNTSNSEASMATSTVQDSFSTIDDLGSLSSQSLISHFSTKKEITVENTLTNATELTNFTLLPFTSDSSFTLPTSQVPTTADAGNMSSYTDSIFMTTFGRPSSSLVANILTTNEEMADTQPTLYSRLTSNMSKRSTSGSAPTSEELTPYVQAKTGSTNSSAPETAENSSTHHTDLSTTVSTEILHSGSASSFAVVSTEPHLVSALSTMQVHPTTSVMPGTITQSLASSTKHASTIFPTNPTSSVITVPSSVSPHGMSTEVSSEVAAPTHISDPTSSVQQLNTIFNSTGSKPTQNATALTNTTLMPMTHVELTTSHLTITSKFTSASRTPATTIVETTSAPVNTYTSATSLPTSHLTTMLNRTTRPTQVLSTTHLSTIKTTATPVVPKNSTVSEMTKTPTAYQRTIFAALTSITASAKATTLPAATVTNTTVAVTKTTTTTTTTLKTTPPVPKCVVSESLMVNTVLVVAPKLVTINLNLTKDISSGLSETVGKALKQTVQVQIYTSSIDNSVADFSTITIGYYVKVLIQRVMNFYIPSAVTEALTAYGNSSFTADVKKYLPSLRYVSVLGSPWSTPPDKLFQLRTVLQVVGLSDDVHTCTFVQTMEQRLQQAFQYAAKNTARASTNTLTVQIVSTSFNTAENALTLTYAVRNGAAFMNGTASSSLLNQLSAELVWSYLNYPPLIIAEALVYPVISTAESTKPYWVYTVLQGVEDNLLTSTSFARLMEQRLAELFAMSQQQARRFKRATTVGDYTVQMVSIQRVQGPKNLAELKYYALKNGTPLPGSTAAKQLSTIDSQTMALKLGYVVQVQAEAVENKPPSNMWIIAAVLAPIAVVTVIIIIIAAVLCRKNKSDLKAESLANMPPRPKPVQGFDFAKKHIGQQGAEDDALPVTQETVVPPLTISQEREYAQDMSTGKTEKSTGTGKSQSPSENGSVMSNESGPPSSGRSTPQKVMPLQKVAREETRKRNVPLSDEEDGSMLYDNSAKMASDPFDTSSGSVQLISIKTAGAPPSHPASDRSQESAVINGEVNKALKQKSDIEHYRNKLRLKAKKKGYYDFPPVDGSKSLTERKRKVYEKKQKEIDNVLDPDTDVSSPMAEPKNRQQPAKNVVYRSRQSLNSPSPGETEMDLLVTRERPRRGIRNSGYDTEPEIIEETNVDRVKESRRFAKTRQVKGHSETSTLSSQPSIDEVRQQMHMLLEEAFSLASAGHAGTKRPPEPYTSPQQLPYSEVVTSAPGTMTRPRGGVQWVPTYGPETYQYSLPRPAFRFSQLPEMVMGSPPPPVPPRTGPVAVTSLRRSTSDIGSKTRIPESSGTEQAQHDTVAFASVLRNPVPIAPLDQSASNYSGDTVPAVFAIPANRSGFTGYFVPRPPASYRNQAWVSYTGESELPGQWADSVPLPGYIEAYPRPHYPQSSPSRLPRHYNQPSNTHPGFEQAAVLSAAASQQSLADTDTPDTSLTNLSTAALVKAIREEVAKLAKKQTDRFEFQV
ncbi:UPF0606 protein KIAA1549L homolog isoform X2 [Ambystoma mexicanum]|uniref:UPF0606 protein KIAA1549L homolog isoform X2 n=1 Tax=Ambystoma mexicanum TaxID=8296 RepID=UPI0037E907EC